MINKILDGIVTALLGEFGSTYPVHTETVIQGLVSPCFSALCANPDQKHYLGKTYFRQHLFVVHYFPASDEVKAEINGVIDRLFQTLEYITVNGELLRGSGMRAESEDDVLTFMVNYNFYIRFEDQENDPMETLTIEGRPSDG